MKRKFIPLFVGLGMLCAIRPAANAQEFKEHIKKEFPVLKATGTVLAIYDLEGSINVEGYAGDKVVLEIDKVISAKTTELVETGKKEFKLEFEQKSDSIIVYIAEPYDTRPHSDRQRYNNERRIEYRCQLQFTVKVPYDMSLDIRTVNNGSLSIQDVNGSLKAHNVNGGITIKNAKGATEARTINGGVTVNYLSVPTDSSSYYTLNGTLEVTYPAALSANIQFKSMNGAFYTDFENTEPLPLFVVKNVENAGKGTMYRLDVARRIKFGNGGTVLKFETMNGNIYVKKQS
ncbi:MAG TPA: hypothetical protein VL727_22505 [Puia sp.]|jgi:hypothetical protein|nr:hypothetical protein [Puia sp.]